MGFSTRYCVFSIDALRRVVLALYVSARSSGVDSSNMALMAARSAFSSLFSGYSSQKAAGRLSEVYFASSCIPNSPGQLANSWRQKLKDTLSKIYKYESSHKISSLVRKEQMKIGCIATCSGAGAGSFLATGTCMREE